VLLVVGGWRCALVADALGTAAPFGRRSSLGSPSSSWSQLARWSAAVQVARHGVDLIASTLVSHEAASARRVLLVVGGWRCALVAGALGVATPFEQRSSPESPSSSWSQLALSSAAVKVARPWRRRGRGRR